MLLLLKRFVGARALDVTDIPAYMNELDHLEGLYFGVGKAKDDRSMAKLRGLYAYCFAMKVPSKPGVHVPYNLLTFLAKMAPRGSEEGFIVEKLQSQGYLGKGQVADEGLRRRIGYAFNWIRDFEEIREMAISLNEEEKGAVVELIGVLKVEDDAERMQNAIFSVAKEHGLQAGELFRVLYMILIGVPRGPRLGAYLLAMGKQNAIDALQRAVEKN
jgi:lysyl-tRNA synthetase class 1